MNAFCKFNMHDSFDEIDVQGNLLLAKLNLNKDRW